VTVSDEPRKGGWLFFLWWMLAFLGFPLGELLALVLVGSVDGVASGRYGWGRRHHLDARPHALQKEARQYLAVQIGTYFRETKDRK